MNPGRPLSSPGAPRRVVPFAIAAGVSYATVLLPPVPAKTSDLIAAGILTAVLVVASFAVPWKRLPAWTEGVPPLAYFGVIALVRDTAGGAPASYAPMAMLPVFWLALYGTRVQMLASIGVLGVVFLAPLAVFGPPDYPLAEWRLGFLWVVIGALVGLAVNRLVEEKERRRRELAAVLDATRDVAGAADARTGICAAAAQVCEADFAMILEAEESALTMTATVGVDVPQVRISMGREASGAVVAFTSGQRFFVSHAEGHAAVSQRLVQATGAVSVLFEPVLIGDAVQGVLVVGWRREVPAPPSADDAISLLAAEAAVAIERQYLLSRLASQARADSLTGLPNRRVLDEQVPAELTRSARHGHPLTVAIVDLDHFKRVNDEHGHAAGDRLLKEAAAAWRGALREGDLLARIGGEEFAVLLPDAGGEESFVVLERLRAATPAHQTCSVGMTETAPGDSPANVMARADRALYLAKRRGRDRTERVVPEGAAEAS